MRRQAKLFERDIFRRLVDTTLDVVLGFKCPALGGDETENQLLVALGEIAQRLEAAGAV